MSLEILLAQLTEAVGRLSHDSASQERWLREDNTWPSLDELVLTFDDVEGAVETLAAERLIGRAALDEVGLVGAQIHEMSQHPEVWEPDALRCDPSWEELRSRASRALSSLERVRA